MDFLIPICLLAFALFIILNFNEVVDRIIFAYFSAVFVWENRYRRGRHSKRFTDPEITNMWYYVYISECGRTSW